MLADPIPMPTARWHPLMGAGHLPWTEAPEQMAAILRGLVTSCVDEVPPEEHSSSARVR